LTATSLADGVILIEGAGANVVAARGPDGVVMVDGGLAENAETLERFATRELGSRDVAGLFNTHWHPMQTGSNVRLGRAGVPIVAHENTRLWLTQEIERPWEDVVHQPIAAEGLPTETFYDKSEMALGDETVEYGFLPQAHTDGDGYVYFRNANVLVAGGVASGAGWPEIDWWTGGWIGVGGATLNANLVTTSGGMVSGLARLVALADEDTQIVPAHGRVLRRADLESQVAMYGEIAQALRDMLFKGFGPEDVLAAAPTAAYDAEMGDSERFLTLAFQSLWGHFAPDA
jgi:glyoxylase-like metal-dependent hydrolase (beta-lactamase superfamily II)